MVHEDALRKFLRWFVGCPLLDQIFPAGNGETLEEEGATLVAFCINGVPGEENVSDLLTKNLNRPQTLKHTTTLGLEDIHQVDLCAVPVVRSCVFLAGLLNSIFDNTELVGKVPGPLRASNLVRNPAH